MSAHAELDPAALSARPWALEWRRGPAAELHGRDLPDPARREVSFLDVEGPAIVLGSAQRMETIDPAACDRAGVAIVRRRGGGGAVRLDPGRQLWVDVIIPVSDPLWDDDVGAAFVWLGDLWVDALSDVGVSGIGHRGGLIRTEWSDSVCFAGLGVGEVHVDGAKLVGISQRRRRSGARFQCVVYDSFDVDGVAGLLDVDDDERTAVRAALAGTCVGLRDVAPGVELRDLERAIALRLGWRPLI